MLFPYQEGLRFVRALYQQGGWDAVNRAYRDPPDSTEQVLHPERYLGDRDRPQAVEVADLSGRLGGGWRSGVELSFGELDARLLLQGELAVTAAGAAAAGWDGGRLRSFQRAGAPPALRTVWDSTAEAGQFCDAMRGWANGRFGASTRSPAAAAGPGRARTPPSAAAALGSPGCRPPTSPPDRLGAAAGSPGPGVDSERRGRGP